MTYKRADGVMSCVEARKYFDLYHDDVPVTVQLPDGTLLGVTGATIKSVNGLMTLVLQTTHDAFGKKADPVTIK